MSDSVAHAIEHVRQQIHAAEAAAGREAGSVRLLAVSKTFPPVPCSRLTPPDSGPLVKIMCKSCRPRRASWPRWI